jgi:membrane-bound lytic murein transglycosylase F
MRLYVPLSLLLSLAASACQEAPPPSAKNEGELVVLTRMAPTTYYEDRNGNPTGPEYDLVRSFARARNLPVRFELVDTIEDIFDRLKTGQADLAAAGLTLTDSRAKSFRSGPAYQEVTETCVCRENLDVNSPSELGGLRIAVARESSYEETLRRLQETSPDLEWSSLDLSTEQLLQKVWEKEIDCTIADSNIVDINQRYFPEIERVFSVGDEQSLVWYLSNDSSITPEQLEPWFDQLKKSGKLDEILNRYYGHIPEFDYYDTHVFLDRINNRLPEFEPLFKKAASATGFSWPLLAAVSYQESQWDPAAVSPTGVRGLFMLTQPTARSLGVTNRLDPSQSALGGARYLRQLLERFPSFIQNPDRFWMTLAAYNVGFGHLQDARRLAIDLDQDPNRWYAIKGVLPHLTQKKYYRRLRHGYARGYEPVLFVEHIRNYQDLLLEKLGDKNFTPSN